MAATHTHVPMNPAAGGAGLPGYPGQNLADMKYKVELDRPSIALPLVAPKDEAAVATAATATTATTTTTTATTPISPTPGGDSASAHPPTPTSNGGSSKSSDTSKVTGASAFSVDLGSTVVESSSWKFCQRFKRQHCLDIRSPDWSGKQLAVTFSFESSLVLRQWSNMFIKAMVPDHPMGPKPSLHKAAQRGDVAEVQRMLDAGVDVNQKNDYDSTPLHYAVMTATRALSELIEGVPESKRVDHKLAFETVALLMHRGADVTIRNDHRESTQHPTPNTQHQPANNRTVAAGPLSRSTSRWSCAVSSASPAISAARPGRPPTPTPRPYPR